MITPKHLIDNAEKHSDKIALSYKNSSDEWISQTWSEFYNSVQSISKSLIASGIEKNDKVSIVEALMVLNEIKRKLSK